MTGSTVTVLGNNSSTLYGWLEFGDYGVVATNPDPAPPGYPAMNTPFPTYYAKKLMASFARGGDAVVSASSNNTLVSAYAVRRANGSLSLLLINKDPATTYSVNLAISGFTPSGTGTLYSYGIPQDDAAKTGTGSPDVAVSSVASASTSFSVSVAPYSLNLYSLSSPTSPPAATSQPTSQTIASGSTVVFSFGVTGAPAPTYQWYLDGTAVASATGSTLMISGATAANAGTYTCVATNSSGMVTSSPALLDVVTTTNPGRLINISCRAPVGTGGNILIAGFVVGGTGTSGSESLLIRASGPALAQAPFDLAGTLPDPQLQLYSGTVVEATNNGWAGSAAIATAASNVGAFPWGNTSSHDAALLETLGAGPYTAQLSGQSGDTGIALAEVYDETPAGTYSLTTPRLINISARVAVGTGGNILIAGFYIGGSTAKTVLIRASGPVLAAAPFNVSGTLSDPQLQLYQSNSNGTSTLLYTNNGWAGNAQVASTAAGVGAFVWADPSSHDSALLVTLPPGGYTAQVSGASGDAGVALVEVYDVQ